MNTLCQVAPSVSNKGDPVNKKRCEEGLCHYPNGEFNPQCWGWGWEGVVKRKTEKKRERKETKRKEGKKERKG